jgi:hypothetical protein
MFLCLDYEAILPSHLLGVNGSCGFELSAVTTQSPRHAGGALDDPEG